MKENALIIRAQLAGALALPNGCVFSLQRIGIPLGESSAMCA